jgi:hypothetical protein
MFGSYRRSVEDVLAVIEDRAERKGSVLNVHNLILEIRERLLNEAPRVRHDEPRSS